jgi:hypothetical protein
MEILFLTEEQLRGELHHVFITGRCGMFSIEFSQYQDMPQNEAHKVISNYEDERINA